MGAFRSISIRSAMNPLEIDPRSFIPSDLAAFTVAMSRIFCDGKIVKQDHSMLKRIKVFGIEEMI